MTGKRVRKGNQGVARPTAERCLGGVYTAQSWGREPTLAGIKAFVAATVPA